MVVYKEFFDYLGTTSYDIDKMKVVFQFSIVCGILFSIMDSIGSINSRIKKEKTSHCI